MSLGVNLSNIQENEKTPLVCHLLEIIRNQAAEIQQLKDEISRLKGNPAKPR